MTTKANYGVPSGLLQELVNAETLRRRIEAKINDIAIANVGIKTDEIMRNKYTGLHYKVKGFRTWVDRGTVRISVDAYRYYQSGRRAGRTAYSSSFISFEDLERVE